MKNKTVLHWMEELASKDGKYTGGSAASVVAAISISLAQFIFELQAGKNRFAAQEDQIQAGIEKASSLKEELLDLAEIDADAFKPVLPLYKLPQKTNEEKAIREEKINEGLVYAAKPPFEIILKMDETVDLYQQLVDLELRGTIVEDITIGLDIAIAAIKSGKNSSMINVNGISNEELKKEMTEKVESQYHASLKKAKTVKEKNY